RVGHRRVEGGDAADRSIEVLEQLAGDPRGDLGSKPARQLILVRDDHPVDPFDVRSDRLPAVRRVVAQAALLHLRAAPPYAWPALSTDAPPAHRVIDGPVGLSTGWLRTSFDLAMAVG